MPEGHTIHRIATDQAKGLGADRLSVSSPQGRFAAGAALLDDGHLDGIEAWGKHLFYRFDTGQILHVHLGLYGKFWPHPTPAPPTHHQVRIRIDGATIGYDLTGPTACDLVDPVAMDAIVARLGPDPLRRGVDAAAAWARLARRRGPIGVALMDQSVLAGVGNVYRAEALFLHGLHPERPANTLERPEWDALWATLVRLMRAGVRARRIVTVARRDPDVVDGRERYVYKQDTCARCGTGIRRWDLAGRWAYACETCQPPFAGPRRRAALG
jgi:endonuclease-8